MHLRNMTASWAMVLVLSVVWAPSSSAQGEGGDPCVPLEVCFPPPQSPNPLTGPGYSSSGNYTLSWAATSDGFIVGYTLEESANGGAWVASLVNSNVHEVTGKSSGAYTYRVKVCIVTCSPTRIR